MIPPRSTYLLKEAALLAAQAGDAAAVMNAVTALRDVFELDLFDTAGKLLKTTASKATTPPQNFELAGRAAALVEAALIEDQFESAEELARIAAAAARKSGDAMAIRLTDARIEDTKELAAEYAATKPA